MPRRVESCKGCKALLKQGDKVPVFRCDLGSKLQWRRMVDGVIVVIKQGNACQNKCKTFKQVKRIKQLGSDNNA